MSDAFEMLRAAAAADPALKARLESALANGNGSLDAFLQAALGAGVELSVDDLSAALPPAPLEDAALQDVAGGTQYRFHGAGEGGHFAAGDLGWLVRRLFG